MNDYFDRPDGEYFVDKATNPVPNADLWETLSVNQLIEAKNTLTNRFFAFQNKPEIAKALTQSIARLDALISKRLAAP